MKFFLLCITKWKTEQFLFRVNLLIIPSEEKEDRLALPNVVYMGTEVSILGISSTLAVMTMSFGVFQVTQGKGKGLVIHTGMTTKMGQVTIRGILREFVAYCSIVNISLLSVLRM